MITSLATPTLSLEVDLALMRRCSIEQGDLTVAQDFEDMMNRLEGAIATGNDLRERLGGNNNIATPDAFARGLFFVLTFAALAATHATDARDRNGAELIGGLIGRLQAAVKGADLAGGVLGEPVYRAYYADGFVRLTATMETHEPVDTISEAKFGRAAAI